LVRLGSYRLVQARYSEFLDFARQALESNAATEDVELRVIATCQFGVASHALGDYAATITHLRALIEGPDVETATRRCAGLHAPPYFVATAWLTMTYALVGDFPRAFASAALGLEASPSPYTQAEHFYFRSLTCSLRGHFEDARADAETAIQLCESHGLLAWLAASNMALGWASSYLRSSSAALPYFERAASIAEAAGLKLLLSWLHWTWADSLRLSGEQGLAQEKARRGLDLACTFGERGVEAGLLLLLAEIDTERGHRGQARTFYSQATATAERLGMRPLLARCHHGLGRLYRRTGERKEAQEHLTTATTMYREMDMRFWLQEAESHVRDLG